MSFGPPGQSQIRASNPLVPLLLLKGATLFSVSSSTPVHIPREWRITFRTLGPIGLSLTPLIRGSLSIAEVMK